MIEFSKDIAAKLSLKTQQVEAVLSLLAEAATIPFIARYRKDKTGALDEVQIQQIQDEAKFLKEFTERKAFIEKTITEQEKMTGAPVFSAPLVDDTPQNFKEPGHALNLIQNDQAVFLGAEVEFRVGEFGAVRR